ncbi:MAG: NosD domain-containing protein [Verrucomicrobiota bacterium]|jgi:hypothetical protein
MKPAGIIKLGSLSLGATVLLVSLPGNPAFQAASAILKLPANSSGEQIQMALDSLPPNGELILSAGIYEIHQPLRLWRDFVTLRGSGPATILRLADQADCPVVILGPQLNDTTRPARHLRLADLVIDGNRANQKAEFWRSAGDGSEINNNGVQIWNAMDAVVEHVVCCHCRSGGLVAAEVLRLLVSDLDSFDNQFDGLACYQTRESRFDGLRLHDNLAAGISLDLAFNHNFIHDAVLAGNDLGVFMRESCDNLFQSLTIFRSRSDGVFIAQATAPTDNGWRLQPGTQCTGNSFEQLTVDGCGGTAFQVNNASCTNNAINDAHFLGNLRGGLGQPEGDVLRVSALVEH